MPNTPLIKIDNLYFKREDLNPTGSAKDRSLPLQIENLKKLKFTQAVLSSTGNAAISAAHFCHQNNIKLTIFLSPKIPQTKLKLIKKYPCQINFSLKPISDAIKFSKKNNAYLLRQSTDPIALTGYQKIAQELIKQLPQITSIFIPVGSGTTLLGISQKLPKTTKIFAVQSAANCPISQNFDQNFQPEKTLLTSALSVRFIPQKNKIISQIKKSKGSGLTINNSEILKHNQFLESKKIPTSLEGALALAGYFKAKNLNHKIGDYPVILLTGTKR
ncbi:MAG: PLP-dependent lyase/thiolase [Candidatus Shapirobacteria bacterium]|nr:PLP-dependent lyase/thiolase [Candidatus Shapirobacteria bacterium]